jgi:hypothetical protein
MSAAERVDIMFKLLREHGTTHLDTVYLLWRVNTSVVRTVSMELDIPINDVIQITWAMLHTPTRDLRIAMLGGALQQETVVDLLRAIRQLQTTPPTVLLPLPVLPGDVLRVYSLLASATLQQRDAAVRWLRANPQIPWTNILVDMIMEFPYAKHIQPPWPVIAQDIAVLAAGLITSGFVVALGEANAPVAPFGTAVVHRAIERAARSMFEVPRDQWPLRC